jgi:hypothetical protein
MSSAEWLPGAERRSLLPADVAFQPRRVPITRFHLCRRNLGQFTSGIDVRVLSGVFWSESRVRDVGCGARSTDPAPSFCNSHFDIRNCIASAHAEIDPGPFSNVECQVQNGFRGPNGGASSPRTWHFSRVRCRLLFSTFAVGRGVVGVSYPGRLVTPTTRAARAGRFMMPGDSVELASCF